MGADSKIEWTHHTFNPWRGCARVSPGCEHCYAETLSKRNPKTLGTWGFGGTRVVAAEAYWKQAIRWNREAGQAGERRRVFCASLADVFEDWRGHVLDTEGNVLWVNPKGAIIRAGLTPVGNPIAQGYRTATLDDVRNRLWDLIHATPHLDWLLLTKRPENALRLSPWFDGRNGCEWPRNIWLGTTCEDQQRADERIPHLLAVPAAVRFLSVEPMLGPVDLSPFLPRTHWHWSSKYRTPEEAIAAGAYAERKPQALTLAGTPRIHWVIVGGESGHGRRELDPARIDDVVAQCKAAGVAVFVKQDSGPKPGEQGRLSPATWAHKEFPRCAP